MNVTASRGTAAIGNPDVRATIDEAILTNGAAAGTRVIDVRVDGGIDCRILPDRGLDISGAWYGGHPMSWISPVGVVPPHPLPHGDDWRELFGGGLLTTCGLRNVGAPSGPEGRHGRYSHLRATVTKVERELRDGKVTCIVEGTVVDARLDGSKLVAHRRIQTWANVGRLEVTDRFVNEGPVAEAVAVLYHVNFGAPLWSDGSRLLVDASPANEGSRLSRYGSAPWSGPLATRPEGLPEAAELVPFADRDGRANAQIVSAALGIRLTIDWDTTTLPRLYQWVYPRSGVNVMAIELANASILDHRHDLDVLTRIVVDVGEASGVELELSSSAARTHGGFSCPTLTPG